MLQKRNYERKMAVLNKQFHFQEQSKALCKPNFHSTIVNVSQTEGEEFGHKQRQSFTASQPQSSFTFHQQYGKLLK